MWFYGKYQDKDFQEKIGYKEYSKFTVASNNEEDPYKDLRIKPKKDISVSEFLSAIANGRPYEYKIESDHSANKIDANKLFVILSLGFGIAHDAVDLMKYVRVTDLEIMSNEMSDVFFRKGEYEPNIYDYNLYKNLTKEEKEIFKTSNVSMETLITFTTFLHTINQTLDKDVEELLQTTGDAYDRINTQIGLNKYMQAEIQIAQYDNIKNHIQALSRKNLDNEIKIIFDQIINNEKTYEELNEELKDSLYVGKLDDMISSSSKIEPIGIIKEHNLEK